MSTRYAVWKPAKRRTTLTEYYKIEQAIAQAVAANTPQEKCPECGSSNVRVFSNTQKLCRSCAATWF